MAHRIEIALKRGLRDARGLRVKNRLKEDFGVEVEKARTVDVYTIDADLSDSELAKLAFSLTDPIVQDSSVDDPVRRGFDHAMVPSEMKNIILHTYLFRMSLGRASEGLAGLVVEE